MASSWIHGFLVKTPYTSVTLWDRDMPEVGRTWGYGCSGAAGQAYPGNDCHRARSVRGRSRDLSGAVGSCGSEESGPSVRLDRLLCRRDGGSPVAPVCLVS